MELLIIILVVLIMAILARIGDRTKARKQSNILSRNENNTDPDEHQHKQQEVDELITVILPTINKDK